MCGLGSLATAIELLAEEGGQVGERSISVGQGKQGAASTIHEVLHYSLTPTRSFRNSLMIQKREKLEKKQEFYLYDHKVQSKKDDKCNVYVT